MLKHEFIVVAIHFDTQWQKVNLCGFVILNSTAYVTSGESLQTQGPIDRGSDRPIIEKGPIDRGSDRPIIEKGPIERGSDRPLIGKGPIDRGSDRPIIEKGPIDQGFYRPNV